MSYGIQIHVFDVTMALLALSICMEKLAFDKLVIFFLIIFPLNRVTKNPG